MTLEADVHAYLTANSQGTNLYMGRLPDSPDASVAIYPTSGLPPMETLSHAGVALERPGFQIAVRDRAYATARSRAEAIYKLLQLSNQDLSGTRYQRVMPLSSPFILTRDLNDRTIIACNFIAMREAP